MTTSNALRMGAACLAACLLLAGCTPEKGTIIQAQKRSQISDNILF